MKSLLTLLLLMLPVQSNAAASPATQDDPAAQIKSTINRDWVAHAGDFGNVVVTSPSYAMPFNQGCVIHELAFLGNDGRPSLGNMVANDLYYVFAQGDACATIDVTHFFDIEPANDVSALLDFGKRLKGGPRPGKDRIPDADLARVVDCFTPDAMASTRIVRAHSWNQKGSGRDDRYQVTLRCEAVDETGEIVASGVRDQDAIDWTLRPWGSVTVEVPAPTKRGDR